MLLQKFYGMQSWWPLRGVFPCPGVEKPTIDHFEPAGKDCGICLAACPHQAIQSMSEIVLMKDIRMRVNGEDFDVPERVTARAYGFFELA